MERMDLEAVSWLILFKKDISLKTQMNDTKYSSVNAIITTLLSPILFPIVYNFSMGLECGTGVSDTSKVRDKSRKKPTT